MTAGWREFGWSTRCADRQHRLLRSDPDGLAVL